MDDKHLDYLFDLQGYLVLKNAINKDDLREMNQWVDDHWGYVEGSSKPQNPTPNGGWIDNVEIHSYSKDDGVNFQNIVESGPVFERLVDNPSYVLLYGGIKNE